MYKALRLKHSSTTGSVSIGKNVTTALELENKNLVKANDKHML